MAKGWGLLASRSKKEIPFLRRTGLYLAAGFEIPSTVIGGALAGYLLDRYLDTSPWFLIGMTFMAFVGACIRLIRWVRHLSKSSQ